MKLNISDFSFEYGTAVSKPVAEEGGRSFILDNRSKYVVKKWAVDKVIFKDSKEERCDFLIEVDSKCGYWIELKGRDVTKACRQILNTISLLAIKASRHEARIITTGTNKTEIRTIEHTRLKIMMKSTGGELIVRTNSLTEII